MSLQSQFENLDVPWIYSVSNERMKEEQKKNKQISNPVTCFPKKNPIKKLNTANFAKD